MRVGTFPFGVLGRAKMAGETEGFVKIVAEKKYDEVLGVHMIGPRATELVAEAAVALRLESHGRRADPHDPRASDDVGGRGRGGARGARRGDTHVDGRLSWSRGLRQIWRLTGVSMATDVVMPQMGESIAEGTIVRWIKKVGDPIDKDEPLFEISTDKVDAEIPSPGAGVLLEITRQGRRDGSGQQRRRA